VFFAIVGYSETAKQPHQSHCRLARAGCGDVDLERCRSADPGRNAGSFQNYSLLPWLTVYENILLAVEQVFPHWAAEKKRRQAEKFISMVSLAPA
jgi:nitrate/nitrite transport system ATP-binding protein